MWSHSQIINSGFSGLRENFTGWFCGQETTFAHSDKAMQAGESVVRGYLNLLAGAGGELIACLLVNLILSQGLSNLVDIMMLSRQVLQSCCENRVLGKSNNARYRLVRPAAAVNA